MFEDVRNGKRQYSIRDFNCECASHVQARESETQLSTAINLIARGPEATSSLGGCCIMFRLIIEFPFLEILDLGLELDIKKWVKTGKNGSNFFWDVTYVT